MSSHIYKVSVEFYENGSYGVIGYNFSEMGLSNMKEVHEALTRVMLKETNKINKDIRESRKKEKGK